MTKNVEIDGGAITDWDSFHEYFSRTLGFPAFYGRNMNAWIDCMTSLDAPEDGMSAINVGVGDVLTLCLSGAADSKRRCPELYDALIEGVAFVNHRRIVMGEQAVLALSFHR